MTLKPTPAYPRFIAKVGKQDDGCWLWTAARYPNGYGIFAVHHGEMMYAHRYSYEAHKGPIHKGLQVRHTCDVRACVNPDHLLIGTSQDNHNDMVERGRSTWGERNPQSKISDVDAREIKRRYAAGGISQKALANRYGVTPSAIHLCIHKRRLIEDDKGIDPVYKLERVKHRAEQCVLVEIEPR